MYEIILSPRARNQLHKLPWKYQNLIIKTLLGLKENPSGKSLERELTGQFREKS